MKTEIKIGKDTTKEGKGSEKEETDLRNREEVKKSQSRESFLCMFLSSSRITWAELHGTTAKAEAVQ